MPFYKIEQEGQKARLVDADNPASALRHVAQSVFTVSKPLKAADVVPLMQQGLTVEKAGEAAAEPSGAGEE